MSPPGLSQNLDSAHFAKWLAALGRVSAKTGPARLACVGDSTTEGVFCTLATTWPRLLTQLLVNAGLPAVEGCIWGHLPPSVYADNRVSEGSGWAKWGSSSWGQDSVHGGGEAGWTAPVSATGKLAVSFAHPFDTIRVYYAKTTSTGTFAVDVGGAPLGSADTRGTGNAVGYSDFTCPAGTHTIYVNPPTGGTVYLMGVEAWLSTDPQVLVSNGGAGGSTTGAWTAAGLPWAKLPTFDLHKPDLTVVMLGINDALSSAQATTIDANLTTIPTKAQLYGDVMLLSVVPSASPATKALEDTYIPKLTGISTAKGCGFLDLSAAFVDYATANALGYMADPNHPSSAGMAFVAQTIFDALPLGATSPPPDPDPDPDPPSPVYSFQGSATITGSGPLDGTTVTLEGTLTLGGQA